MPTIEVQVAITADDSIITATAAMGAGGTFSSTSAFIAFGNASAADKQATILRFIGVNLPVGAVITAAYLKFIAQSTLTGLTCNVSIWGNDDPAPTAPTNVATFWGKVKTTAQVNWNNVPAQTINLPYNSIDISAIIQELVNSYAPYALGVIQIIIWDNASSVAARRTEYDVSGSVLNATVLHIDYTVPTVATLAPTNITFPTVDLNGSHGGTVDDRGFDYGPTIAYGTSWTEGAGSYPAGVFNHNVTLTAGTWHFRAKVLVGATWFYGADIIFDFIPSQVSGFGTIHLLDNQEINANDAFNQWPCAMGTNMMAVAFHSWQPGAYSKITIKSYFVDPSAGTLTDTGYYIDAWNCDELSASPCLLKMAGNPNFYVLVAEYTGGNIRTAVINIDETTGILTMRTDIVIGLGTLPRVLEIFDGMFCVAYRNAVGSGTLYTVRIDSTTAFILSTGYTLNVPDFKRPGGLVWYLKIAVGNKMFMSYRTNADIGMVRSYNFDAFGLITDTGFSAQIDSGDAETGPFSGGAIIEVGEPRHLIIYAKSTGYGTSKCTGSDGTITASTETIPTYKKENAFDGSTATTWRSTAAICWIAYQFSSGVRHCISKYSITNGATSANDDPKTWTFEGSNDGVIWHVLDTQTGITWASRPLQKDFLIYNTRRFAYYRLNITAIGAGAVCEISEIQMFTHAEIHAIGKLYTFNSSTGSISYAGSDLAIASDLAFEHPDKSSHYGNNSGNKYVIGLPYLDASGYGQVLSIEVDEVDVIAILDKKEFYGTPVPDSPRLIRVTGESGGGRAIPEGSKFWVLFNLIIPIPTIAMIFALDTSGGATVIPLSLSMPMMVTPPGLVVVEDHSGGAETAGVAISMPSPPVNQPHATSVIERYQAGDDGDGLVYGNNWEAMTFTPATSHSVAYVGIKMRRVGQAVGNVVTIDIYDVDGLGKPTGAAIISINLDFNGLPGTNLWLPIFFGASHAVGTTKHAIVIHCTGGDIANYLVWRKDGSAPSYAGGSRVYSTDAGASWTVDTGSDYLFDEGDVVL